MKVIVPLSVRKPVRTITRSDGSVKVYGWNEDGDLLTVIMIRSEKGYDISEIKAGGQIIFWGGKKLEYPNPYDDPKFKKYVRHMLDTTETEPFCPFGWCGYCHCAYSKHCYKCEEALEAYNET